MSLLYNILIGVSWAIIRFVALFNPKTRLFAEGRKNWKHSLLEKVEPGTRYIWFHSASLGEFEQGRPVIEEIRKRYPQFKIALTFFSPSGYEIRKNYGGAEIIMYLPMDTRANAWAFLEILRPEMTFFIKYEYWYNYISESKKRGIPLYVFSAIFRESQPFFRKGIVGKWFRKMLLNFHFIFVQDSASEKLLHSIGVEKVMVSGDTRFDRVAAIAQSARELPLIEKFRDNKLLIIAGSTWKPDEDLIAEFLITQPEVKCIFAPHEVSEININRLETMFKNRVVRLSNAVERDINNFQVLIIDSIGLLSSLYRYGTLAYIGGGFGAGIHNILEAATFGLPVVFGPNYQKFKEAVDLINMKGAYNINDAESMKQVFTMLLNKPNSLEYSSQMCNTYVAENVGATIRILNRIFN
jgi:3-deoxy-D-manno-octulosonic-acid transferase